MSARWLTLGKNKLVLLSSPGPHRSQLKLLWNAAPCWQPKAACMTSASSIGQALVPAAQLLTRLRRWRSSRYMRLGVTRSHMGSASKFLTVVEIFHRARSLCRVGRRSSSEVRKSRPVNPPLPALEDLLNTTAATCVGWVRPRARLSWFRGSISEHSPPIASLISSDRNGVPSPVSRSSAPARTRYLPPDSETPRSRLSA